MPASRNAIVSYKQLGDIILLEPLARLLAQRSGGVPTDLFTKRAFAPIVDLMPHARARAFSLSRYDELWAAHPGWKATRTSLWLRARAKKVIFPPEIFNPAAIHRFLYDDVLRPEILNDYWALYFWEGAGGPANEFTPPELSPPPPAWKSGLPDLPDTFVVCHPTAAWESKFWVPEKWGRLIDFLEEEIGVTVVLTSGSAANERHHCGAIMAHCRHTPCDLSGALSVMQYAWVIANARALIAIDGSACHLADAFRVPAVKLFGQTPSERWHYERPGARVVTSSPDPPHLRPPASEISPEDVMDAISSLLDKVPSPD